MVWSDPGPPQRDRGEPGRVDRPDRASADHPGYRTYLVRGGRMQRVIALVGPTAVGKSAIAVELSVILGAEIVSCDSMQVYRSMPILTESPTHAQRAQIQHHLIDCIEPTRDRKSTLLNSI